jgi:hypothetical protein
MNQSRIRTLVAASLAFLVAFPLAPASASAPAASLSGRVVSAGTDAPVGGARVHVANARSGRIVTSEITRADGLFEVAGLEPASYDLAVESRGGLYVVETPVRLAGGERRSLQLAVSPQTAPAPAPTGQKEQPAGQDQTPNKKSASGVWNNPLTATLIVVGAAVVVGLIVESVVGNDAASPSVP